MHTLDRGTLCLLCLWCEWVLWCLALPAVSVVCQGGDTIDLGRGHVLEFIDTPNLHWPDTMFTLDRGTGVMYTCDAFGMHYCSEAVSTSTGVRHTCTLLARTPLRALDGLGSCSCVLSEGSHLYSCAPVL